jgi:leader peptidase (prepilin peptidase)/N-methyltransferase
LPWLRLLAALVGGPLAIASFAADGLSLEAAIGAFFIVVLVALSLIDLEERRIPNRIVLPATAIVLAAQIVRDPDRTLEWAIAALGAALFFFIPRLLYPAGLGMGDVKLALLLGAALGGAVVVALLVATFAVLPVSLGILVVRGFEGRKAAIPFGPFLAFGGIVAWFLSDGSYFS